MEAELVVVAPLMHCQRVLAHVVSLVAQSWVENALRRETLLVLIENLTDRALPIIHESVLAILCERLNKDFFMSL
jgi:hypothetical protein